MSQDYAFVNRADVAISITGMTLVTSNKWTHIAFVRKMSEGSIEIYQDGVLESSRTGLSELPLEMDHFIIGNYLENTSYLKYLKHQFWGRITDFRVYNVAKMWYEV